MDQQLAALAERQHGVLAARQLSELGLCRRSIDYRLEVGRLHRIHRGVYAVGHGRLSPEGRWMGAVLAVGRGAVLSHRFAAAALGLRPTGRSRVEVTAAGSKRSRPGIEIHRLALPADEVTTVDGIPTTSVPRTLFDLAAVVPRRQVERAVHEAEVRRLFDALSLVDLLERYPKRRGAPVIRVILADRRVGLDVTRSELEERFLAFVEAVGLSRPEVNIGLNVGGRWFEVDCVWREQRLIVELDGRAAHTTMAAFERDRDRDRVLTTAGWRVIRITWRQLQLEVDALALDLRRLLA